MKIGACILPSSIPLLVELGYDYFECNYGWLACLDDATYAEQSKIVEKNTLVGEAFNGFFPGNMQLYAKDGNQDEILRNVATYTERGFARATAWGCRVVVIGSGGARAIPEGMTREETEAQFARVLAVCGETADKYGVRVTIEPLSRNECNYLHTIEECMAVAKLSGHPSVGGMIDFYHHNYNQDAFDGSQDYADKLYHAHFSTAVYRNAPTSADVDELNYVAGILKHCPHIERLSLECAWKPGFEVCVREARPVMELFRTL